MLRRFKDDFINDVPHREVGTGIAREEPGGMKACPQDHARLASIFNQLRDFLSELPPSNALRVVVGHGPTLPLGGGTF